MNGNPLVSIGVPVRNGGDLLVEALELLVNQTYKNIEIVISDNNSSDATAAICSRFKEKDIRIRYFRQNNVLTALDNFRFVFEQSTGDYFMWAAHDDRRSLNYIEVLLAKILTDEKASLVFSDVTKFSDFSTWKESLPIEYDFACDYSEDFCAKISNTCKRGGCLHVYGLLSRRILSDYNWIEIDYGPDRPLLFYLSCRGSVVRAEGACFYWYRPIVKKTNSQRAIASCFKGLKPFHKTRLSWACAKAGCYAERLEGRNRNQMLTYFLFQSIYIKKSFLLNGLRKIFQNIKTINSCTLEEK